MIKKPTTDDRRPTTLLGFIFALLLVVSCGSLVSASPIFAAEEAFKPTEYKLLAPIPQLIKEGTDGKADTTSFIPGLFKLAIALATGLAVLMLIYGGIQYMSTDAWGEKNEAKGTITNAIMGLLLTLSAWLIIYTINPKLVEFNLQIGRVEIKETASITTVPGGTGATGELQQRTTSAVAGLREACSNCTIRITSTTGDSHDPNSLHFQGLAVDIGADTNLTRFLTGQTTNPRACATYLKTLNGVNSRFLWEPVGSTCGGAVPSTGDHWHMSVIK